MRPACCTSTASHASRLLRAPGTQEGFRLKPFARLTIPAVLGAAAAATLVWPDTTFAQNTSLQGAVELPPMEVQAVRPSLTVPTTEQAQTEIQLTPGGVELIPDTVFRNTPAQTVKDVLGWTPGVIVQPRYGDDGRVSIRGSGLSRNYGNRGLNMFMDGIPINTSDGLVDLFEIDPTAYRYVEVFKGANALRFGANSLGGAVNFVTPTGRDAFPFSGRIDTGSYGYLSVRPGTYRMI